MKSTHEMLEEFYKSYVQWLDNGAHDISPYRRDDTLCGNIRIFADDNYYPVRPIRDAMVRQFIVAGLDKYLPFNTSAVGGGYNAETRNSRCHLNPARNAWVRRRLIEKEYP